MIKKSPSRRGGRGISVYSNLNARRRSSMDARSRRKAEYLSTLPKHPVKRLLYRMHPKRFFAYWFSREGGIMAAKIAGVGVLVFIVMIGALFAFFRRDLDAIRPGEISKRVQTTVTKYYDRNDVLLWEDKGDDNYKLVVESDQMSKYIKQASVAIEDKDFYNHPGVSITGITRAAFNNFSGGSTQGGSTLTQQLVKQVFFADESGNRGLGGVPRKIKEAILAIEVERMYNKDQILALYLNESPYGGRRNGVESAAQTYFGKSAKDLNLAESALLAGIPQLPGIYDPYNTDGHKALIARQHTVLNKMVEQNYVSKKEAEEAKKIAILDTIRPESETYTNIKAPHFVREVRRQLQNELGDKTVGNGGLTIKTTLDYRAQEITEKAIQDLFSSNVPAAANFDNAAVTIVDVPTGQILAMIGSRDFNHPGYGSFNSAVDAYLQPGSSIKPLVFASLFKQRDGANYGAGTVLRDENINSTVGYELNNFDNKFRGDLTIRQGLAESRNIPAVKAYLIDGRENVLNTIHELGDRSYCTQGVDKTAGVSLAIGGCTLKQVEHVNSFATIARGGVYKKESYILEVKNPQGQVIKQWKNDSGRQVIDPQIPYIISDILSDDAARQPSFGRGAQGLNVPGVKTATKTGTSNIGKDSRDLWMMSYSPKVSMGIWVGNHDSQPLRDALSSRVGPTVSKIMGPIHTEVFAQDGTWKSGDWFTQPEGVQRLTVNGRNDLFPSWYTRNESNSNSMRMTFDSVSKKKATDCTPERAKTEQNVSKITDPVTRKEALLAPNGYNANSEDDVHDCSDVKPFVSNVNVSQSGGNYQITASINQGTHSLQTIEFKVDDEVVATVPASNGSADYTATFTPSSSGKKNVTVTVIDQALYDGSSSKSVKFSASSGTSDDT